MEKLPLCPSPWADLFPFALFPLTLLFCPVYKVGANDFFLPRANVQRLALFPMLTGAIELHSSHIGPIMESFLN